MDAGIETSTSPPCWTPPSSADHVRLLAGQTGRDESGHIQPRARELIEIWRGVGPTSCRRPAARLTRVELEHLPVASSATYAALPSGAKTRPYGCDADRQIDRPC